MGQRGKKQIIQNIDGLAEELFELRDLARTGLPVAGMTSEQWAHHRLARIARSLDSAGKQLQYANRCEKSDAC